ncbi:phosphate binding protein [Thermincola ferriacetica]|uniref:Phosphate-binding protein n=1 Tax=Thermincola ferriacetica TaxID=281456 RepID=A0A0L6W4Y2_9FIRM|nr:phosphate ABC transporter substrate-binding protein [Thermincola ferriacetica]KNZ70642.1 phosphate binding protein [Thermincola ferriacetica]
MQKLKKILLVTLAALLVFAVVGCSGTNQEGTNKTNQEGTNQGQTAGENGIAGSITAVGSTALQPLVDQAAQQFMSENPDAQIVVNGGGSGTGLTQVSQGAANIGNSDVFAEEKDGIDASQLVDHKVAVVGMAAVVNPKVKVNNLTKQQLIDIFTGKITNWKDVGGIDQKITLVNRPKGSGTRATFKKYALDGAEEASGIEEDSSGTVRKIIAETPGAIGYLALSYVDKSVVAVSLDGVAPTKENIVEGKYPVWSYEHMYTKGEPKGLTKAFLDYMLSDDVQKTLVPKLGYIPVTEMKVEKGAK